MKKIRENIVEIAKALATENYEAITKSLEAMTTELDTIETQMAEAVAKAEAQKAEVEAKNAEELKKHAELYTFAENLPALMQGLVEAVKLQSEGLSAVQKSLDELKEVAPSRQDKTEEVKKSVSPLDELSARLFPM